MPKTPALFRNMFGFESVDQLREAQLHASKVRLFQVKLEEEAVLAEKAKLETRIRRLERETKDSLKANSENESLVS